MTVTNTIASRAEGRFTRVPMRMWWALALGFMAIGMLARPAAAQAVHWIDTKGYQKPAPVRVNLPNESTTTNKYWVDMSGGSGSSCTQSSPCRSLDDVVGKPGTTGGPAIIYLKGTGNMSWYQDRMYGSGDADCRTSSCANWILIRTWPAGSPGCSSECTATITGNSNLNSSSAHHIAWDGGPDLKIRFESNGSGTYANNINSNYHLVYRTQTYCSGSNNKVMGWQVGSTTAASHVYFINNEFYGCANTGDQSSAVYVGPGNGGGYNDFVLQNNIIRDFYGECVEINPRVTSSGLYIGGNVMYNCGRGTCSGAWLCRPGITVGTQSGGGNNGTVIENNLMWSFGSSCIWDRGGGTPAAQIRNNTCYNYGNDGGDSPNPEGIAGYGGAGKAIVRNNIIFAGNGTKAFNGTYSGATNNACAAGDNCGSSSVVWSASSWLSTDPNSSNFLKIGTSSPAKDAGANITAVLLDFTGASRPADGQYDIGAFEANASTSTKKPNPPTISVN